MVNLAEEFRTLIGISERPTGGSYPVSRAQTKRALPFSLEPLGNFMPLPKGVLTKFMIGTGTCNRRRACRISIAASLKQATWCMALVSDRHAATFSLPRRSGGVLEKFNVSGNLTFGTRTRALRALYTLSLDARSFIKTNAPAG